MLFILFKCYLFYLNVIYFIYILIKLFIKIYKIYILINNFIKIYLELHKLCKIGIKITI